MTSLATPHIIGVDTGGTYTDAVLVDTATRTVIAAAKRPTTHYDLGVGVEHAVGDIIAATGVDPAGVGRVAVSTTLATNAVVEGYGADVGLIIIGWGGRIEVPGAAAILHVAGGHRIDGTEQEPLGLEALIDSARMLRGRVDAYAVCSLMSFANPAHELVAAKALGMVDPRPVFCSHEVSCRAGMQERAATAVLNARLLPVMQLFLEGVSGAMQRIGITGEVVVVRGDATVMPMTEARRRAAFTVASGPAATASFGAGAAHVADALVVDVGGTTTDVTLIRNGRPVIDGEGMVVGQWTTHVEAVEMFTVGIGGDSHVRPGPGQSLQIGPQRVVPLAMAGPLPDPTQWLGTGRYTRCLCPSPAGRTPSQPSTVHALLLERGPMPPGLVAETLRMPEITVTGEVARLVKEQAVVLTGFTPTDALHVLGELHLGDAALSTAGARALGSLRNESPEAFARSVLAAAAHAIEDAVVQHVARREVGGNFAGFLAQRRLGSILRVAVSLGVPMVGIGAAAKHLLEPVAKALGTSISFPDRHDVGNAFGAALLALGDSHTS